MPYMEFDLLGLSISVACVRFELCLFYFFCMCVFLLRSWEGLLSAYVYFKKIIIFAHISLPALHAAISNTDQYFFAFLILRYLRSQQYSGRSIGRVRFHLRSVRFQHNAYVCSKCRKCRILVVSCVGYI